ncbi:hypothetical protein [Muribaculum intestinale]|uniref:hypothetical protein n=1 Tax=Muribaculum intestinale TaxID=1796646 RepID=UPI003F67BDD9
MKKIMWLMLVALLSLLPSVADAKKQAEPVDSVRILFIGNSFTYHNKMPQMVDSIATSQKRAVSITTVVKGGQRLSDIWRIRSCTNFLRREAGIL